MKRKAQPHPFAPLMGMAPLRIPQTGSKTLVLEGKVITDARQVGREELSEHPDDQAIARSEKKRQRQLLEKARRAARYQRQRQDPNFIARRKAWQEAHREERRAYMGDYRSDPANQERINASKRAWQKRAYAADPEKYRQAARDYYQRNRDAIRERAAQRRAAKRAAAESTS